MIDNRKVYNIKIFNDELDCIIANLLEKIRQLKQKAEEEQDDVQKTFIKANIQKIHTIITRLDTGIIYNNENYEIDTIYNEVEKNI